MSVNSSVTDVLDLYTPRFRRNPEAANLERAAKELASLKQLSPACGYPAQGRQPRLRQRGKPVEVASLARPT